MSDVGAATPMQEPEPESAGPIIIIKELNLTTDGPQEVIPRMPPGPASAPEIAPERGFRSRTLL
jgi:hypothetical protein